MSARKLRYVELHPYFFPRGAKIFAYVRPRYSAGSGALVHDDIALGVAEDEKRAYGYILEGLEGAEAKKRAEVLGLRGIAYVMAEKGSGRKFRWLVQDLITGECYYRHHDDEIRRLGFTPFKELSESARADINQTGRESDYERTFWKFAALKWHPYEVEIARLEP